MVFYYHVSYNLKLDLTKKGNTLMLLFSLIKKVEPLIGSQACADVYANSLVPDVGEGFEKLNDLLDENLGITVAMALITNRSPEVSKYADLILSKCDTNIRDAEGYTVYHYAAAAGKEFESDEINALVNTDGATVAEITKAGHNLAEATTIARKLTSGEATQEELDSLSVDILTFPLNPENYTLAAVAIQNGYDIAGVDYNNVKTVHGTTLWHFYASSGRANIDPEVLELSDDNGLLVRDVACTHGHVFSDDVMHGPGLNGKTGWHFVASGGFYFDRPDVHALRDNAGISVLAEGINSSVQLSFTTDELINDAALYDDAGNTLAHWMAVKGIRFVDDVISNFKNTAGIMVKEITAENIIS